MATPIDAAIKTKARSLYRSLLRELPPRPILLKPRTPVHSELRRQFIYKPQQLQPSERSIGLAVAEQYKTYFQAQRHYVSLIEQYNPGMGMSQEERVRLSARRVGMDLPSQFDKGKEYQCKLPQKEYNPVEHWEPAPRLRSIDVKRMRLKEKYDRMKRGQEKAKQRELLGEDKVNGKDGK